MQKLAQTNLFEGSGLKGYGTLGLENGGDAPSIFANFISSSIGLITIIGIIWFIFIFFIGAIGIITSGGDKNANEAAKKKITSGVIGLVVTVLGLLIVKLIGSLIGLGDILDFNRMFSSLTIK